MPSRRRRRESERSSPDDAAEPPISTGTAWVRRPADSSASAGGQARVARDPCQATLAWKDAVATVVRTKLAPDLAAQPMLEAISGAGGARGILPDDHGNHNGTQSTADASSNATSRRRCCHLRCPLSRAFEALRGRTRAGSQMCHQLFVSKTHCVAARRWPSTCPPLESGGRATCERTSP